MPWRIGDSRPRPAKQEKLRKTKQKKQEKQKRKEKSSTPARRAAANPCTGHAKSGWQGGSQAVRAKWGGGTTFKAPTTGPLARWPAPECSIPLHAKTGSSAQWACAGSYQKRSMSGLCTLPRPQGHRHTATPPAQAAAALPAAGAAASQAKPLAGIRCLCLCASLPLRRPGRLCALRGWSAGWRRCLPAPRGRFPAHNRGRQWPAPCWRFARPGTPSRLRCGWCG